MAANYQTGTATDPQHLMSIMNTYLTTQGWVPEYKEEYSGGIVGSLIDTVWTQGSPTVSQTYYTTYYTKNGSVYFISNRRDYDYFLMGMLDSYSTSVDHKPETPVGDEIYLWSDQVDYVGAYQHTNNLLGPYTKYHFFEGFEGVEGAYFYCVVETGAGVFVHFGIGELDRIGDLSSTFAVGTYWNTGSNYIDSVWAAQHSIMFDGRNAPSGQAGLLKNDQIPATPVTQWRFGYQLQGNSITYYRRVAGNSLSNIVGKLQYPNAFNGRSILVPCYVSLYDTTASVGGWYRVVGLAPNFRTVRIDFLQPEDVVDTDWMVFPIKAKNGAVDEFNSSVYGFAYKFQ